MAYKMGKIIVEAANRGLVRASSRTALASRKSRAASSRKGKTSFDPKTFLARVGDGRSLAKYRKGQIVFSQGEIGDAVFYIQKGKVKVTVVSEQGKEAVVAILGVDEFFGEGCLAGQVAAHVDGRRHDGLPSSSALEKAAIVRVIHAGTGLLRNVHCSSAGPGHPR